MKRAGHLVDGNVTAEADGEAVRLKNRMFPGALFGHE